MTVATTSDRELDIDDIVTLAYRQSALASPYEVIAEERKTYARTLLEVVVKSMATDGLVAKTTTFETVTLVRGQYKYPMPSSVLGIEDVAKYMDPTVTDLERASAELPVTPINHYQWQEMAVRSLQSIPLRYYAHRSGALVEAWIWPEPGSTEAGGHIRFKVERLRADSTLGANTPDFESFWTLALTYELAYHLSLGSGMPTERSEALRAEATKNREKAKGKAFEHPVQQLEMNVSSRWRR